MAINEFECTVIRLHFLFRNFIYCIDCWTCQICYGFLSYRHWLSVI